MNIEFDKNKYEDNLYDTKVVPQPVPKKEIGIDTDKKIYDNIIDGVENSSIDMTALNNFTNFSQNRENIYQLLDMMAEDSTISAILETYAEDATATNDQGKVMWVDCKDEYIGKYVNYLLDTINVDKNAYNWIYSLCKYGDLYLKLYRESDFKDELFDKEKDKRLNEEYLAETDKYKSALTEDLKKHLDEDIIVKAYAPNDHIVNYLEIVPNPAEMFELTRFSKSYAYIQAPISTLRNQQDRSLTNNFYNYKFKKNDINIYNATCFVHGALEDNSSRTPEQVEIFKGEGENGTEVSVSYTVKRGQSILYNSFKIWRELTLLENSLLLNRLTRSSITRILSVEVGDMPKEQVGPLLNRIKQMIEQKSSIDTGASLQEYTNPGPSENIIYIPMHEGVGNISTQDIGGEVNPGQLNDIDYFKNKLFGSLRVPKQYFGETEDSTGFNGGTSLSIISARYARTIKRVQNTFIQVITDAINLMLLDKGLSNYINQFQLRMMSPVTQEDIDRREAEDAKIGVVSQLMGLMEFDDGEAKLKILKTLLADVVNQPDIMQILQDVIDKYESGEVENGDLDYDGEGSIGGESGLGEEDFGDLGLEEPGEESSEEEPNNETNTGEPEEAGELPSPEDLGVDLTNSAEQ